MPAAVAFIGAQAPHNSCGHLSGCVRTISTCHKHAVPPEQCCLQITAYLTAQQEDVPEEAAAAEEDADDEDAG